MKCSISKFLKEQNAIMTTYTADELEQGYAIKFREGQKTNSFHNRGPEQFWYIDLDRTDNI